MISIIKNNMILIALSAIVLVCASALMMVSQEVYQTQKHVNVLEKEKQITEWEIRALSAEIAFLTRPDRLDKLSTVMMQSVQPSSGQSIVMSPVHFSALGQNAVLPGRKPVSSKHASVQASPSTVPVVPTTQSRQDISSLLNAIGGEE